jgi:hypothetical protein
LTIDSTINLTTIQDSFDIKRLAVKEQQDSLYAKTGIYTQIRKDNTYDGGLGIEQNIIADLLVENQWVDVYTAPCGSGWVLNQEYVYTDKTGSTTNKVARSAYGCLAVERAVTF